MWCPAAGQHESELTQLSEVTADSETSAKGTLLVRQGDYIFSVITSKLQTQFNLGAFYVGGGAGTRMWIWLWFYIVWQRNGLNYLNGVIFVTFFHQFLAYLSDSFVFTLFLIVSMLYSFNI